MVLLIGRWYITNRTGVKSDRRFAWPGGYFRACTEVRTLFFTVLLSGLWYITNRGGVKIRSILQAGGGLVAPVSKFALFSYL